MGRRGEQDGGRHDLRGSSPRRPTPTRPPTDELPNQAIKDESGKTIYAKPVYSFKYGSNPIELPCIGVAEGQPFENFTSVVPGLEIPCVNGTQSWTGYYWPGLLTSDPDIITEYGDDPPFKVPVNLHIGKW